MSIFREIRERIPAKDAAEYYGIHVNRRGMACCPFHDDKTPSMKVDERYHCFACGADGDAINFVSHLFGIPPIEAARKLAEDFGIPLPPDPAGSSALDKEKIRALTIKREKENILYEKFRQTENAFYRTLCEYARLLEDWAVQYRPSERNADPDPRFVEAMINRSKVDYLIDGLFSGSLEDRISIIHSWGGKIIDFKKAVIRHQRLTESCA